MNKLILYLLESSAALTLLYLLYLLLLRKETFFNLNRFFLLAILTFSLLIPIMSFEWLPSNKSAMVEPIDQLGSVRRSYHEALAEWNFEGNTKNQMALSYQPISGKWISGNWILTLLLMVYAIGVIAILFRLSWSYRWIAQLRKRHLSENIQGITVVSIPYPIAPFSFMNCVFVSGDLLGTLEFQQILAHEKTHIQQKHSIDLLIVQLLAAVLWFNPVVWLLIKSLKTTHEYIADKKMMNQGYSLVEYQSLLLRQLISNNSYGLGHNFNLAFIKKRITMMKIKDSGWTGRAKVAFVLSIVIVFGLVMMQCNSSIDEQVKAPFNKEGLTSEVSLPVLPATGYVFNDDYPSVEISIAENQVNINGETYQVNEIGPVIKKLKLPKNMVVIMKVDRDQSMGLVRDVQWELRVVNARKLLYLGKTSEGKPVEMAFLLPPTPNSKEGVQMPVIDDQYATEHDIDLHKVDLANDLGSINQKRVYDFVKDQIRQGKSNYVVSAKFDDHTPYGAYLLNLTYVQEGFNAIYEERSQQMFSKSFYDLDRDNEVENEQYLAVRKGVPRAISVAEE